MVNYSTSVINSQSYDNFTDFVKNLNKTTYSSIFIETTEMLLEVSLGLFWSIVLIKP